VESQQFTIAAPLLGLLVGLLALVTGVYLARQRIARATQEAEEYASEKRQEAEAAKKEILVAAHETGLAQQEEADKREREIDERDARLDQRQRKLDQETSVLGRERKRLEQDLEKAQRNLAKTDETLERAESERAEAKLLLETTAGMDAAQARAELVAQIESVATKEAEKLARKIEDEARQKAELEAVHLMVQAAERVDIDDVVESTVSFIELPSDEMKGRIIGREGRNIRALEMATGIDLIVDDTPRSILISSFDPVRREIARVAIDRLVEDGRIHPARIEEVVAKATSDLDERIDAQGNEAAYALGISDLHSRLSRMVGRMRYHTDHGQNLLRHCIETAQIAAHMAQQVGARLDVVQRAGLLHGVAQVVNITASQQAPSSAELCAKHGESDHVVEAIASLQPDGECRSVEAMLVHTANKLSEARPGARKENLAVFIERLTRLEAIATGFDGVDRAYAVKAGKEIRVILDAASVGDDAVYQLSKKIARTLEKELNYPGQIKVSVIRETRAVRYAM
jgi:ribonuclease Y